QGRIQGNSKFPDMKALCDYVHSRGLKIGIYSSPGPRTCAGYVGTYQHEDQDAQSYADWGFDYVKYDWCSYGQIAPERTAQRYAELLPESAAELKTLAAERAALAAKRPRSDEENARLREIGGKLNEIYAKLDQEKRRQADLVVLQEPYRRFRAS